MARAPGFVPDRKTRHLVGVTLQVAGWGGLLNAVSLPPDNGWMCRSIRPLFNFEPPATDEEVRAASLQFVRKIAGFTKPSRANAVVFDTAVDEVAGAVARLLDSLSTAAAPRSREEMAARARARSAERFGRSEAAHPAGTPVRE